MPRPPIPTSIHVVKGTARKDMLRRRSGELLLEAGLPDAPDWMPPEAQREWGRLTSDAKYAKALAKVDRGILTVYCILWARFATAEQIEDVAIRRKERLTPTELMVMVNVASKLGLNPCDRVKLRVPELAVLSRNKFASLGDKGPGAGVEK